MGLTTDPNDPELGRGPGGTGQNAKYLVLSEEERAKGFVRPVRHSYEHIAVKDYPRGRMPCGAITTIGTALAETYARDPNFYGATFCVACNSHFPVSEFVWDTPGREPVGS